VKVGACHWLHRIALEPKAHRREKGRNADEAATTQESENFRTVDATNPVISGDAFANRHPLPV